MRHRLIKFGFAAAFITILSLSLTAVGQKQVALEAKLIAADISNGATFGYTADIDGDTAVIGAWQDKIGRNRKQGAVYVFVEREGAWINQAKLVAADGKAREYFGQSVAISGDTIVVGVPQKDVGSDKDQGAAYVFSRSGDAWTKQVKLVASGGRKSHLFGASVGISGNTIIVGAPGEDSDPDDGVPQAHGAAYIFEKINDNWTEKQKITGTDKSTAGFGINVAIDNKTAIVASATERESDHAIYVFSNPAGRWELEQRIANGRSASDKPSGSGISKAIAIDGNTFITGGTHKGSSVERAAFVFVRNGGKWTQQAKLVGGSATIEQMYAFNVDVSGDIAVVSSARGAEFKGTAYVFRRSIGTDEPQWEMVQKLAAADSKMFDQFGWSVAVSGNHILVGADNHDLKPPNQNEGAAYIFSTGVDAMAPPSATKYTTSPARGRKIKLVLNARKNGYTLTVEGRKAYFQGVGVENPYTKKPLEGLRTLSYGCETPSTIETREVAWSQGRMARLSIACALIHEPEVLVMDEPSP